MIFINTYLVGRGLYDTVDQQILHQKILDRVDETTCWTPTWFRIKLGMLRGVSNRHFSRLEGGYTKIQRNF